jgi:hypothetical protein
VEHLTSGRGAGVAQPGRDRLGLHLGKPSVRRYLPETAIALELAAVTRLPRRESLAAWASAAVTVAMFGLGAWSFSSMLNPQNPGPPAPHCNIGQPHCPVTPGVAGANGPAGGTAAGRH